MKKIYIIILLILFIGNKASLAQILTVNKVIQEQNEWCWAGVSKCILDYYGNVTEQCEIAEYTRTVATWHNFGDTDCCINPSQGCNYWNYNWGYAGSILDILEYFGSIDNYGSSSAMSENKIELELINGRPFVIRWRWYSGGGHFVVGHGKDNHTLFYMDPWYGEGLKFANYNWVVDNGIHEWTHTNILTISPWGIIANEDKPQNNIIITPNPSDGHITIQFDTKIHEEIRIEIFNTIGQFIYSEKFKDSFSKVQLFLCLPRGLYTVRAIANNFSCSEKLLIQ